MDREPAADPLDPTRQLDVLDDLAADALMPTGAFVHRSADEDEPPRRDGLGASGIVDAIEGEELRQDLHEGEGDRALPERLAGRSGQERDQVRPRFLRLPPGDAERLGTEVDIAVDEQEPLGASVGDPLVQGPRLAHPALGPLDSVDHPERMRPDGRVPLPGFESVEDRARGVDGLVVDDGQMQGGIVLGEDRSHGRLDVALLVMRGDDDVDRRGIHRRGVGGGREGPVGVHPAEQSQGEPRPREGHRSRQQGQHEGDGGHQRAVPAG